MMGLMLSFFVFFFSSRRRHTRCSRDWSSDVCSSDLRMRIVDLPALDRETTAAIENAHSRVRAFVALRNFVRGFNDPHFRIDRKSVVRERVQVSEADVE